MPMCIISIPNMFSQFIPAALPLYDDQGQLFRIQGWSALLECLYKPFITFLYHHRKCNILALKCYNMQGSFNTLATMPVFSNDDNDVDYV